MANTLWVRRAVARRHPPAPGALGFHALRDDSPLTVSETWTARGLANVRRVVPGLLLSSFVAVSAVLAAPLLAGVAPIPAMVIALVIGIALNPLARRSSFQPGIVFCLKTLLRWAVALLGLRVALGEIAALGLMTAVLVIVSMGVTLTAGFLLARVFAVGAGLWGIGWGGNRGVRSLRHSRHFDRLAGL